MLCSFHGVNYSQCAGISKSSSTVGIPLSQCKKDLTRHLSSLGISEISGQEQSPFTEVEIILNRAGHFNLSEEDQQQLTICEKHRKFLTTGWPGIKSRACRYPTHTGKKTVNSAKPRRVTRTVSNQIYDVFHEVVPAGSGEYLKFIGIGKFLS